MPERPSPELSRECSVQLLGVLAAREKGHNLEKGVAVGTHATRGNGAYVVGSDTETLDLKKTYKPLRAGGRAKEKL